MDQPKLENVYEKSKIYQLKINFYVLCIDISIQSCKGCQTVQTLYKTRINKLDSYNTVYSFELRTNI